MHAESGKQKMNEQRVNVDEEFNSLVENSRRLAKLNSQLINYSGAMLNGLKKIYELVEKPRSGSRHEYEESMEEIINTIRLTLTRANNYSRDYDIENR